MPLHRDLRDQLLRHWGFPLLAVVVVDNIQVVLAAKMLVPEDREAVALVAITILPAPVGRLQVDKDMLGEMVTTCLVVGQAVVAGAQVLLG